MEGSQLPPLKFIRKEESPLDIDTREPMTPTGLQYRQLVYDDILSVFLFKERVKLEDIRASVKGSVCKHPRFHSSVVRVESDDGCGSSIVLTVQVLDNVTGNAFSRR